FELGSDQPLGDTSVRHESSNRFWERAILNRPVQNNLKNRLQASAALRSTVLSTVLSFLTSPALSATLRATVVCPSQFSGSFSIGKPFGPFLNLVARKLGGLHP